MAEHVDIGRHDQVGNVPPGRMYPAVGGDSEIAELGNGRYEAYHRWPQWPENAGDPPMVVTPSNIGGRDDFYQKIRPVLNQARMEIEEKNPMLADRLSGMPIDIREGKLNTVVEPWQPAQGMPHAPMIEVSAEKPQISERMLEIYERYYHAYQHMQQGYLTEDRETSAREFLQGSYRLQEGREISAWPQRVDMSTLNREPDDEVNLRREMTLKQKLSAISHEINSSDMSAEDKNTVITRVSENAQNNGYRVQDMSPESPDATLDRQR